jgi:hypothetical protein
VRPRLVLVVAVVAAVAAAARTQQILPAPVPQDAPTVAPPTARAAAKSLDQLIDRLEDLRAQKAELDRQEAELVKEIRRKMERQSDRLHRLGVGVEGINPGVIPPAPSVSYMPTVVPSLAPLPPALPVALPPASTQSAAPVAPQAPAPAPPHRELARLTALGIQLPPRPDADRQTFSTGYLGLFGGN